MRRTRSESGSSAPSSGERKLPSAALNTVVSRIGSPRRKLTSAPTTGVPSAASTRPPTTAAAAASAMPSAAMLAAMIHRMPQTIAALAALLSFSCASGPPKPPPPPAPPEWSHALSARADALEATLRALPQAGGSELVVRLAFEPGADLDLYVTDPLLETVYYANTPARSGGALDADRRCTAPGDSVESVGFAPAPPGPYRVGVDFQQRCSSDERVVPWVISIDAHGERRLLRGLAVWNVFASRVEEFSY
jgi:hypothetical protein